MASKKTRILKKEWPDFIREFNRQNQFRRATVLLGDEVLVGSPGLPLAGLTYDPEGRRMEVCLGVSNPQDPVRVFHSVEVPRAVYLLQDDDAPNPVVGLQIQGAPKSRMSFIYLQDVNPDGARLQWIANVAFSIYEAKGKTQGDDQADWYQAEALVNEVASRFV